MQPMVDETFVARESDRSAWLPLAIVGLFVRARHRRLHRRHGMARAGRSVARDLRVQVLGKYLRLPGSRFDAEPVPSMLVRAGLRQRPGRAGRDRRCQGDAAAVVTDHRDAGRDAVDELARHRCRAAARSAAGLGDGQGRQALSPHQPPHPGKRRAICCRPADQALSNHQEVKVYGAQDVRNASAMPRWPTPPSGLVMKVEATRSISSALVQLMGAVGLAVLLVFAGREADDRPPDARAASSR